MATEMMLLTSNPIECKWYREVFSNQRFNIADAVEETPMTMYFVVDGASSSDDYDVMNACATAMLKLFSESSAEDSPSRERLLRWSSRRIRKVIKRMSHRAKHRREFLEATESLVESGIHCVCHSSGTTLRVWVFTPMEKKEVPDGLLKLQLLNDVLDGNTVAKKLISGESFIANKYADAHKRRVVTVIFDASLEMSLGKICAQGCHAVQLAVRNLSGDEFNEWDESGYQIDFCFANNLSDEIELSKPMGDRLSDLSSAPTVVKDACFTEAVPNSVTAVCLY